MKLTYIFIFFYSQEQCFLKENKLMTKDLIYDFEIFISLTLSLPVTRLAGYNKDGLYL